MVKSALYQDRVFILWNYRIASALFSASSIISRSPGPFVIDSAKVEDAVDDDPVQFTFVVVIGELFRIGAYGIEADEEVTAKAVAFTVVESDDICVIIVLQILAVHFEYLLVRAEDIGYFTDSFFP